MVSTCIQILIQGARISLYIAIAFGYYLFIQCNRCSFFSDIKGNGFYPLGVLEVVCLVITMCSTGFLRIFLAELVVSVP